LDIRRDRERKIENIVDDTLTVEYSRNAGRSLHKKAVSAFKFQAHAMFFDTDFNDLQTVLKNIYHNFIEAAMKFHRSVKALSSNRRPSQNLLIKIVDDVLEFAFVIVKSCQDSKVKCVVTRAQVKWLGAQAFKTVLARKQTSYRALIKWLEDTTQGEKKKVRGLVSRASCLGVDPFPSFRY
jgi:telomerase reverse transcriptase